MKIPALSSQSCYPCSTANKTAPRKYAIVLLSATCLFAVFSVAAQTPESIDKWKSLPAVIMQADKLIVTKTDVSSEMRKVFLTEEIADMSAQEFHASAASAANTVFDRLVLLQLYAADGITPNQAATKTRFEHFFSSLPENEKTLFMEKYKIEPNGWPAFLENVSNNPDEQYKTASAEWLKKKHPAELKVSQEEVETFYRVNQAMFLLPENVTIAQIFIDKNSPQAADKAATVIALLKQGENFGNLAEKYSECTKSKNKKGVLGTFSRNGELPEAVEECAFTLGAGQNSDIIKTELGYFIIRVNDRRKASFLPMEKVDGLIRLRLINGKMANVLSKVLNDKKSRLKVISNL